MKTGTDYNDTVGGQNYAHGRVVYKRGRMFDSVLNWIINDIKM